MADFGTRIVVDLPFEQALGAVAHAVRDEGLALIATIDVREHFRRTLGRDFRQHAVIEVWSPEAAFDALQYDLTAATIVLTMLAIFELADGETAVVARHGLPSGVTARTWRRQHRALADAVDRERARISRVFARLQHHPRPEGAAAHAA